MITTKLIFLILHLFGVALGAGAAFLSDWIFLQSIKDNTLSHDEHAILSASGKMTWIGLGLLYLSGIGLTLTDPMYYLTSEKFLMKMGIVVIITLNGLVLHRRHLPFLGKHIDRLIKESREIHRHRGWLIFSGAVSIVSWSATIVLGALRSLPIALSTAVVVYILLIAFAWVVGMTASTRIFRR